MRIIDLIDFDWTEGFHVFLVEWLLSVSRFDWVQWSWLIIHSSWPFSLLPHNNLGPEQSTLRSLSTLHMPATVHIPIQHYILSPCYTLHVTNMLTLCHEKHHHMSRATTASRTIFQNIIIMRETDFLPAQILVYDLQGQWKFFAMGSFVNWAEIWWMYVGVGVGVGLHIIDLVRRVTRKKHW